MLMARPPPDNELRRSSLPGQIQLPSFSHFVAGVGQAELPLSQVNRSPTSRSDPTGEPRLGALLPRHEHIHARPSYQSPAQGLGQHAQYVDVRPKGTFPPAKLSEPYRDYRDPKAIAANHIYPSPQDFVSNRNHLQTPSPGRLTANSKNVVTEATIEGKGLCYVYDDGTVCQKVINGDMVNPKWGTTKAGKPRKRLGQACNVCREKKIRCDPQLPKCAQCQKFGRECKFESSSRSSKHSSNKDSISSRENQMESHHERTGSSTSTEALTDRTYSRANSRGSMNVESLLSPSSGVDASPSSEQPPSKKPRFSSSPRHDGNSLSKSNIESHSESRSERHKTRPEISFAFDVDPFLANPRLTMHFVKEYFKHVNSHIYVLFQTKISLHWIEHCQTKTSDDRMLLYAMLAAGAAFSPSKSYESYEYQFKNIAEVALDRNDSSGLQSVQTQLLLSMVEHTLGQLDRSRELSISAIRMAYKASMSEEVETEDPIFGMDLAAHLECRRRTFWLAVMAVCFHGNRFGPHQPVERLTWKLRLPCDDNMFQASKVPDVPYFQCDGDQEWEFPHSSKLGNLAFLVELSLITNELAAWLNNTSFDLSPSDYSGAYESFYHAAKRRLSAWDRRVRDHYRVPEPRMTGLHILYHFAGMLLHRHVRHEYLSWDQVERSCRQTRSHATLLLELIHLVHEDGAKEIPVSVVAAGCPMAGDTIVMAIDVITAAGTISSLLEHQSGDLSFIELVSGGLEALDTLGANWKTAEQQLKEVKPRISTIVSPTTSGTSSRNVAFFIRKPLISPYGLECDVVYGISRLRYLQALGYGDKVKSEDDICEMGSQSPN